MVLGISYIDISILIWVTIKNSWIYKQSKSNDKVGINIYVFLSGILISWILIKLGIYTLGITNEAISATGVSIVNSNIFQLILVLSIDLLTSFVIKRNEYKSDITGDISAILSHEIIRAVWYFLFFMTTVFILNLIFWGSVLVANIFHIKLGFYQF